MNVNPSLEVIKNVYTKKDIEMLQLSSTPAVLVELLRLNMM